MGSSLILIIQILCLALWIGGSVVVLAFVTPEIFGQLADKSQAGRIAGAILKKFRTLLLAAAVILGITIWIQIIALGPMMALRLRLALILVSFSILIESYIRFFVSDRMKRLYADSAEKTASPGENEYRNLHRRSLQGFVLNLFLGITVVITLALPSS
ncbi:MAG: DUF4149 domain-containing protein [Bacteroidota bacterium]